MVSEVLEGDCLLPATGGRLTFSQVNLLKLIRRGCDEEEGWSLRKLAMYMQVSLPAVSKAVGRLTPSGYLEVRGDSRDGRKRRIAITKRGEEALADFEHCRSDRRDVLMEMGAEGNVDSWNESLEGMIRILIRLCREGHVPSMACECSDHATFSHEKHSPGCPVRRYLHHLDE
jgi:DNA-binding MarR family transcriptional regulator